MTLAIRILVLSLVAPALAVGGTAGTRPVQDAPAAQPQGLLEQARELLDRARDAAAIADHAGARDLASAAVARALEAVDEREDPAAVAVLAEACTLASRNGADAPAELGRRRVLAARERALPAEHRDLLEARSALAASLRKSGDLRGARDLLASVDAVRSRTLAADDPDLLQTRHELAFVLLSLGDLDAARELAEGVAAARGSTLPPEHADHLATRGLLGWIALAAGRVDEARAIFESVLAGYERTASAGDGDLQAARSGLAEALDRSGDAAGARLQRERAVEELSRIRPPDDPTLLGLRLGLGNSMAATGDLAAARRAYEEVVEALGRSARADDPTLGMARARLGAVRHALGEHRAAREDLELALASFERTLQPTHPNLRSIRRELISVLEAVGDLVAARAVEERALAALESVLPEDHPDVLESRLVLAELVQATGDGPRARALAERVLAVRTRTAAQDDVDLLRAREVYANILYSERESEAALAIYADVLSVLERTRPEGDADVDRVRGDLANALFRAGELEQSLALRERVVESLLRSKPANHPDVLWERQNLSATLFHLRDFAGARAQNEEILAAQETSLPDGHPDLQVARKDLAVALANELAQQADPTPAELEAARMRCAGLLARIHAADLRNALAAPLEHAPRELEERQANLWRAQSTTISFAMGYGVLGPIPELDEAAFVLGETTRAAALVSARLRRAGAATPEGAELGIALAESAARIARCVQSGRSEADYLRAVEQRDAIERALVALTPADRRDGAVVRMDLDTLATRLGARDALVGFQRFVRTDIRRDEGAADRVDIGIAEVESLCAFVVRRAGARADDRTCRLTRVDLGPIAPIRAAVEARSGALSGRDLRGLASADATADPVTARGTEVRRLVLDPLLPAIGDVDRIVFALDDVLNLVPIDALPLGPEPGADERRVVGERWRIETRTALWEFLVDAPGVAADGALVAVGGASYAAVPETGDERGAEATAAASPSVLRGGPWERGFSALPSAAAEARDVARLHASSFGDAEARLLEGDRATRKALEAAAPAARWIHVATHGWFAPESVRPWGDVAASAESLSAAVRVQDTSPMALCGLALAGANVVDAASGVSAGILTGEEISAWDLARCELVVLSACDTNVGVRRAGQGVASLQKALHMAGARTVITSLWKVPDDATRELMVDFYRRVWVAKESKAAALLSAKLALRDRRDADGAPVYAPRDWAGWVLTGEPD